MFRRAQTLVCTPAWEQGPKSARDARRRVGNALSPAAAAGPTSHFFLLTCLESESNEGGDGLLDYLPSSTRTDRIFLCAFPMIAYEA